MESICKDCACRLRFTPELKTEYLATKEERANAWRSACSAYPGYEEAEQRSAFFNQQLVASGQQNVWKIHWECLGCRCSSYSRETYLYEEAQALADQQNRFADLPEALEEAQRWRDEEERNGQSEAKQFAALFLARFPQWENRVQFIPPNEHPGIYLVVAPRPDKPEFRIGMEVQLMRREVLVLCNGWHEHFTPSATSDGMDYMIEALETMEAIFSEKCQFARYFKDGNSYWGEVQNPGKEQTWDKNASHADTIYVSSWRGTYQQVLNRPK